MFKMFDNSKCIYSFQCETKHSLENTTKKKKKIVFFFFFGGCWLAGWCGWKSNTFFPLHSRACESISMILYCTICHTISYEKLQINFFNFRFPAYCSLFFFFFFFCVFFVFKSISSHSVELS